MKLNDNPLCAAACTGNELECENGGYQDPDDCSKCICTELYEGTLCDTMKGGVDGKSHCSSVSLLYRSRLFALLKHCTQQSTFDLDTVGPK